MREIIVSIATNGLDHNVHRIIGMSAIETNDGIPTGKIWHEHINPQQYHLTVL